MRLLFIRARTELRALKTDQDIGIADRSVLCKPDNRSGRAQYRRKRTESNGTAAWATNLPSAVSNELKIF